MSSTVVVREPEVSDAESIARVHGRAWQAGYAEQIPAERLRRIVETFSGRADQWRTRIAESTVDMLVAAFANAEGAGEAADQHRDDGAGEVVGICTYGEARDADAPSGFGELYMINLDPTAWGTGLADALFSAAAVRLAESFDGAYLWVLSGNHRARRFYRRHGWTPDGTTRILRESAAAGLEATRCSIAFR